MPSTVVLTAKGLSTSPNNISGDGGGLGVAENIIIRRDNVIESRRGYKLFDSGFGTANDRAKQIMSYKERLILHYSNVLKYQDGVNNDGTPKFTSFAGTYTETETGLRMKSIEANGNLYFTTSEGIKKISASSASNLSASSISAAGGIKALDLVADVKYTNGNTTGFLPSDSTIAYRVLWSKEDANENLIPGTPSQRCEVYNSLLTTNIKDFNILLGALDNINQAGSYINDGNYVSTLGLSISASATDLYTNLIALATKIDQDILYADNDAALAANPFFEIDTVAIAAGVCTVTFINVTPGAKVSQYFSAGDKIYLTGTFTPVTGTLTGLQTISTVSNATNAITFATAATGAVTIDATSKVESGKFRNITQPSAPSTPATNTELAALQTYINGIITALRTSRTQTIIANDTGASADLNIDAAACTIAAGIATITFSAGDPRDYVAANGYIYLTGFTPVTGSVNGLQQIASVTATTLTFSTSATGAITVAASATIDKIKIFSTALAVQFIDVLAVTTASSVNLTITIPEAVTTDWFYQIYRSSINTATGTTVLSDLTPSDELQLVYEAYPTVAEITAREILVEDITPDAFRGANLYTNAATGEGILQANDVPPFAKDINRFKNTLFFANTRTKQRLSLNLLGVTNMIADYAGGVTPKVTLANSTVTNTYSFVTGRSEVTDVDCVADVAGSLNGKYFLINNANNKTRYYVWYATSLTTADPAIPGRTGIRVQLVTGDAAATVAQKTRDTINVYNYDFTATITSPTDVVHVTNVDPGYCDDASDAGATGFTITVTTQGRGEKATKEQAVIGFTAGATFAAAGASNYFTFNTAEGRHLFYVWFQEGTSVDPALGSAYTGIQVTILNGDTAAQVVTKAATAINTATSFITASPNGANLTVTSSTYGDAPNASITNMPGGSTISITEGALEVLLSDAVSPSIAVDETARSFVRIANKNLNESVSGFYLSGSQDVPGKMFFESETLNNGTFFAIANNATTGASFNPDISPDYTGITSTFGATTTIALTSHGLVNGDQVVITSSDSNQLLDGVHTVTRINANSFSIPITTISNATKGGISLVNNALSSSNEEKANRVYYSKVMQPEAVPMVNYLDVGAEDKAILRIFPLRDSLFVYKEDGLYRISGEVAPFTQALFDSSVILIAPDSLDVCNSVLYGWTTQGIVPVTEGGPSSPISRDIDDQILKLGSVGYTHFSTATWGKGYESDNCYKVWTVSERTDTVATTAYRYNTLTNSWTVFTKTNTCGITNPADDKEYLGAGDTNKIEVERKDFSREDYADREFTISFVDNSYYGTRLAIGDVSQIAEGDVIVQDQTVSIYQYNQLLKKLDTDPGVTDTNYYSTLALSSGGNMRTALVSLATKLDADVGVNQTDFATSIANLSGSVTSFSIANPTVVTSAAHGLLTGRYILISSVTGDVPDVDGSWSVTKIDANTFNIGVNVVTPGSGGSWATLVNSFQDIRGCYNIIIDKLNTDTGVSFNNYQRIVANTQIETVVNSVNYPIDEFTVADALPFIQGTVTVYKAIPVLMMYEPNIMGDALGLKQCREATIMFDNKAFTRAKALFSTDLQPEVQEVSFNGDGNGIFGSSTFGNGFFGGASNSAPFRTYVPRQCQRCRYLSMGFSHGVAREQWSILGTTITAETGLSSRAYR